MREFTVRPLSRELESGLRHKINNKTKPLHSLGMLEDIALQYGLVQKTLMPRVTKPAVMVFAGDHGIAKEGVAAFPQEVTAQMVQNFLAGGAAINVFARQHDAELLVVNAGVASELPDVAGLVNVPIARGTASFLHEPAMEMAQAEAAVAKGAELVEAQAAAGCNTIAFGEMGIGNTSAAAMLMHAICGTPLKDCVGRGAGLDDGQLAKKLAVLAEASTHHGKIDSPMQTLATFGGLEIAMIAGGMLRAAELGMVIIVDGFIVTSALLVAHALQPDILQYCIFAHQSGERGHRLMLEYLGGRPLLDIGLRLGEGSGAALALPLVRSAVLFLDEMASFESAHVSEAA